MAMQRKMLVGLAAAAVLIQLAVAADYIVGGQSGSGWDTSNTNLQNWASSQKFTVGDSLTFQYTPNHNVLEVSKSDYDNCQSSSALDSFSDGNTTIRLKSTGKRYFICGVTGHCLMGMKLMVDTKASAITTPSAAASPAPALAPAPAPAIKDSNPVQAVSPAPEESASESPFTSPALSPDVPEIEFPTASPTPSELSLPTPTPPSSATRGSSQTSLVLGFALVAVMRVF